MAMAAGPQPGTPVPALLPPPAASPAGGPPAATGAPRAAARHTEHTVRAPSPERTAHPSVMGPPTLQPASRTPASHRLGPRPATSVLVNWQDADSSSPTTRPADGPQLRHPPHLNQRRLPPARPGPAGPNPIQPRGDIPAAVVPGHTLPPAAPAPHSPALPDIAGIMKALPPGALFVWNAPPVEAMVPGPAAPTNMPRQPNPALTHPPALCQPSPLRGRPPPVVNPPVPRGPPPQGQLPPKRRKQQALQALEPAKKGEQGLRPAHAHSCPPTGPTRAAPRSTSAAPIRKVPSSSGACAVPSGPAATTSAQLSTTDGTPPAPVVQKKRKTRRGANLLPPRLREAARAALGRSTPSLAESDGESQPLSHKRRRVMAAPQAATHLHRTQQLDPLGRNDNSQTDVVWLVSDEEEAPASGADPPDEDEDM